MKNTSILFSIILLILLIMPVSGQSVKYVGTVEYNEEIICTVNGAGSDDTYRWNTTANKTRVKKGSVNVAFTKGFSDDNTGFALYGLDSYTPNFHLTHNINSEGHSEKVRQNCTDWEKKKTTTVKPGDAVSRRSGERRMLLGGPETQGSLQFEAGKYSLTLIVNMKESVTTTDYSEYKYPCREKNPPPESYTSTIEVEAPVIIAVEKEYGSLAILEGTFEIEDTTSHECNCPGLEVYAAHGDLDCSYSSKITAKWSLLKQCETMGSVPDELDKRDISSSVKERIKDMINKVNDPNTTDTYVFTGWYIISTVKTIDQAHKILDKKGEYMTDLRKLFDEYCSKSKNVEDLTDKILTTDKGIVDVINRFNQQYISEHILTPGQNTIKDYVADQQQNPNSAYNSYGGK